MSTPKKTGWRATIALAAGLLIFWGSTGPVRAITTPETDTGGIETAAFAVSGSATFYCNSDRSRTVLSKCHHSYPDRPGVADMYAAAGPAIRAALGDWRGQYVTVSRAGHGSVTVRLVDWCACGSAVIDLYADAMWKLGGSGRIRVTVSWGTPAELPSTDTEGEHGIYRPGGPLVAS